MRIKEFKTIANGLFTAIKKIIEFKFNYKSYLSDKEFSDEKIKKIIDDLTLIFIDYEKEKSEEKETFILETLLGFAFFHNHELFVKLYPHIKKDLKEIFENLFSRELLTVSLKDFSKEETIKNISFINNSTINILCLYYGLKNNNEELVEIIGKIELNDDITKKTAKDVFLDLIVSHGNKIKIESHKTLIKNILNEQPIDNLFKDYHLSKKRIKNINKFFNISLTDEMLKNNIKLDTQNLDDNFVINLLSNDLNSETNFEIIKKLLAYKEDKKLKKNIKRLKNKKLLNDSFFERIFKDFELDYAQSLKSKSTLRNLFNDLEDLSLSFEIKNKAYEKLKEMALDGEFNEVNDYKNFVLNYPNRLSIEELVKILLHKGQSYVGLTDYEINLKNKMNVNYPEYFDEIIHINLKDDFFINTHKENSDFFNNLLKKYPEQMNNMNCFRLFVERSNNDLLVTKYLDYFKEKYGIEKIKEIPFTKINVLNENDIGGLTLNWFIENNLLNKIINDNNSLINFGNHRKNFLVEDLIKNHNISADFFIKQSVYSFISNHQLFKFILNNFEITKQTQQFICNSVVSIDAEDLAKEIVKKGIVPNEYYQEKFKNNLNTSSNILLKGVLKNKLENLENKTTQKEKRLKI